MIADAARIRSIFRYSWIFCAILIACVSLRPPCLAQRPAETPSRSSTARRPALFEPQHTGPSTLLNESGSLKEAVPAGRVQHWQQELRTTHLKPEAAAWREVWLGETELARNDQPERALSHFEKALRLSGRTKPVHGLAAYDTAQALYFAGAYADSASAFKRLLAPHTSLPGYDRRNCALWFRHAAACAGYHQERARLGIPEPPRLDPLRGVAALTSRVSSLPHPLLPVGLRSLLGRHVLLYDGPSVGVQCGGKIEGLHCNLATQCPMDHHPGCGASHGDPVNLATGEEEYTPEPDLVVYNPKGPSVVWDHLYNSLRGPNPYYESYDTSIADCYNRQINYSVGRFNTQHVPASHAQYYEELVNVTQIVAPGTPFGPPYRYRYGYTNYSNLDQVSPGVYETVPFLSGITTPAPNNANNTVSASITYDPTTDAVAHTTDGNGNTRTYSIVNGSTTKVTIWNASGTALSYTVTFDGNMNLLSLTDGTNSTKLFEATYADANDPFRPNTLTLGNGIATNWPGGIVPQGYSDEWHFHWDTNGNLLTRTTPRGAITTCDWDYTSYNETGRLTSVQEGAKTPTSLSYDTLGRPLQISTPLPGSASGSGQTVNSSVVYTTLGNIASLTIPGNNAAASITTSYNYTQDPLSNRYNVPEAYGEPLTVTRSINVNNPNDPNNITELWYDNQSTIQQVVYPIGVIGGSFRTGQVNASYNVANQLTQVTPLTLSGGAAGANLTYAYSWPGGPCTSVELMNNATLVQQVGSTLGNEGELLSVAGNTQSESWGYDAAYRRTSDTDGNGNQTKYAYNTQGYLADITYPGYVQGQVSDSITFPTYDYDGHPTSRVDGRNVSTNYSYLDVESRLVGITYTGMYGVDDASVTYDSYGRMQQVNDGSGYRSVEYDDNDLVTQVDTEILINGNEYVYSNQYTYYPDAQLETMVVSGGGVTGYGYDTAGRLTGMSNSYGQNFTYTYYDTDWLATRQCGTLLSTAWTPDYDGFVLGLSNSAQNGSQQVSAFTYSRDATLNRTSQQSAFNPQSYTTTNYGYDTLNRLTSEATVGGGTLNDLYDSAGNPTLLRGQDPTGGQGYNSDNQNKADTYDGNGNPTIYGGNGLLYNAEDRLTTDYNGSLSCGWRADGLRAWKQSSTNPTYFLYDGANPVCEINSTGTTVTAVNLWGPAGLEARYTPSTGATTYYAFDGSGNASATVNSSGAVTGAFTFDGYGKLTSGTPTDPYSGYGGERGYYTDQETGLVQCGARFYDPNAGRFLNRDPIGAAGGANLYQYVGSSPLMRADPSGLAFDPFDDNAPDSAMLSDFAAGDHPGIEGVKCAVNFWAGAVPGYSLIPAITGHDIRWFRAW